MTKIVPDGKLHKFEARDGKFWIDGDPTLIVAGEMHFGRILPEDWETRIKQAKAMGLNTISFYLFWNLCEPEEGKFNFTGMTDVRRVLKLCQDNGMWAILRPGPYCCAEVEYGGIPYWTLKYPDVKIRSTDPKWLQWSKDYIEQVYKQVGDLQVTKGGPLLMVQMDNEFGMISQGDYSYMAELQKIFTGVGFDVQLFACDPGGGATFLPGVLHSRNGFNPRAGLGGGGGPRGGQQAADDFPVFASEVYTNWFNAWGTPRTQRYLTTDSIVSWVSNLVDANDSLNLYVFHGGTTYGFFNGCNEYLPLVNSYDYGAPIDEAGRVTDKFKALRALLIDKLKISPPEPPADPAVITIPAFTLTQHEPLLDMLPAKPTRVAAKTIAMEDLDQAYGAVDYRKKFDNGIKGKLELKKAMDYSIVMINGKTVGKAFRGYGLDSNIIDLPDTPGPATLDILVYNLGRISVITAPWTQDRAHKGLIDGAALDGKDLSDWEMYSVPMDHFDNFKASNATPLGPVVYHGSFALDKVGGSFLDMQNWGMGAVWVNGHNLGRFWDRGPERALFVPAGWLKQGQNDVVVVEFHDAPQTPQISGTDQMVWTQAVPFAVKLDSPASFSPNGARGGRGRGFGRGARGATSAPAAQN